MGASAEPRTNWSETVPQPSTTGDGPPAVADADPGVVVTGEGRPLEVADGRPVPSADRCTRLSAMACRDESTVHGEADGTPDVARVVGIAAHGSGSEGSGPFGSLLHQYGAGLAGPFDEGADIVVMRCRSNQVDDDPVCLRVHVPAADTCRSRQPVEPGLGRVELPRAVAHQPDGCSQGAYGGRLPAIGHRHREPARGRIEPGTGIGGTGGPSHLALQGGCGLLRGQPRSGLAFRQAEVPPHGGEQSGGRRRFTGRGTGCRGWRVHGGGGCRAGGKPHSCPGSDHQCGSQARSQRFHASQGSGPSVVPESWGGTAGVRELRSESALRVCRNGL